MKLSGTDPVIYNVGSFTSCAATPNNESVKTAYTYRFMYLGKGKCTLILGGDSFVFRKGGLLFLLPGERYRILNSDGDFSVTNIFFDLTRARVGEKFVKWHLLESEFDERLCGEILHVEDAGIFDSSRLFDNAQSLSSSIEEIKREWAARRTFREEYLGVLLKKLLLDVASLGDRVRTNTAAAEMIGYIEDNITLPLGARELGERFGYNIDHVGRLIRGYTQMPLHEYVLSRKIDRAGLLLRETDLTIAEVAQYLGFSDSSHFSRVFRRFTGQSPSELRK